MCKIELFKNIVGYDSRFYFGDFADDDISFRIRRAGCKLIYARDTFVHHFGSVTVKEDHIEYNSLEISRKNFIDIGINATIYNSNLEDNAVVFVNDSGETNVKFKLEPWSKQWFV